jgi:hypothetical protein
LRSTGSLTDVGLQRGAERAQFHHGDDPVAIRIQELKQPIAIVMELLSADPTIMIPIHARYHGAQPVAQSAREAPPDLGRREDAASFAS